MKIPRSELRIPGALWMPLGGRSVRRIIRPILLILAILYIVYREKKTSKHYPISRSTMETYRREYEESKNERYWLSKAQEHLTWVQKPTRGFTGYFG